MTNKPDRIGSDSPRPLEPIKRAEKIPPALESDKFIYRMAVTALSLTLLGSLIFGFVFAWFREKDIPQFIVALGSASVGGLAGLLAPATRRR